MRLLFSPGAILALILRNFLVVWELSSLSILAGFRFESIPNRNINPGNVYFQHDRITRVSESRDIEKPKLDQSRFDAFATKTRRRTTTCLKMLENTNDPDILLKMVEDLAMEEITPKIMAKMEVAEIALTKFLEEKSAEFREESLLKPPPPRIPPPSALIDSESDDKFQRLGQKERDLTQVGKVLEKLRQRLREEGGALPETEETFQQSFEDEEILRRAKQALRKSREAAKLRKAEAELRSVSAAKVSAVYRQQQQQIKKMQPKEHEQEKKDKNSGMKSFQTKEEYQNSNKNKLNQFDIQKKRPTIELESLFGERVEGDNSITMDSSDDGSNQEFTEERDKRAPEGIPMLCNWMQDEDGCITGKIKGSIIFEDGATISTSSVAQGARGGTEVTTGSGSRYFLEELVGKEVTDEDHDKKNITSKSISTTPENNTVPKAPDGVPIVKGWEFCEGGGIIGLIYDSPDANDGDCIETSPIVDGEIEDDSVVSTRSGSRYFLSGDLPKIALDSLLTSRDDLTTERRPLGGTITLAKKGREGDNEGGETSRSTFSLLALFGGKRNAESSYSRNSAPQPLPPPSPDKIPPIGTPTLTGCVFNDDRTITGYIFGSPKIDDGCLITTSPIVDGERMQFETVTTATGSLYFLG